MPKTPVFLLISLCLFAACSKTTTPLATNKPQTPRILEISFNNIQNSSFKATAKIVSNNTQNTNFSSQTLTPSSTYTPIYKSQSTFTFEGYRYLAATFQMQDIDSPPNYSFIAIARPSTLQGTAVSNLKLYDGSAANPNLARQIMPLHALQFDGITAQVRFLTANFQAWPTSDFASLTVPSDTTLLNYGFVARNPLYAVTFAVKLPIQATKSQDPYSFTLSFADYSDDVISATESLEEQTNTGVDLRADYLSANQINIFPNSTFTSSSYPVRKLCFIRTAIADAASGNPDAYLFPIPSDTTGCVL
jgi:hypothetical protein